MARISESGLPLWEKVDLAFEPINLDDPQNLPLKKSFLIDDLIEKQSLVVFYGAPKKGKTLALVDLSVKLLNCNKWFGLGISGPNKVFYVAFEDPDAIKLRFYQSYKVLGNIENHCSSLRIASNPPDIFSAEFIDFLHIEAENDESDYDEEPRVNRILIIDTLAQAMAHLGDENSSSTMGKVIERLRLIISLDWTVIVVAHTGKDHTKGIRGHSSLEGALDNAFFVDKRGASPEIIIKNTLRRNGSTASPFKFKLLSGTIEIDADTQYEVPYLEETETNTNTPTEMEFSKAETIALNSLQSLLETSATNIRTIINTNDNVMAVQRQLIAEMCAQKGISAPNANIASRNRATKRALDALVEKGLVKESAGFYWMASTALTKSDNTC